MKKYTDGKREIMATEKAYEVIYKSQGFKEVEEVEEEDLNEEEVKENFEEEKKKDKKVKK